MQHNNLCSMHVFLSACLYLCSNIVQKEKKAELHFEEYAAEMSTGTVKQGLSNTLDKALTKKRPNAK